MAKRTVQKSSRRRGKRKPWPPHLLARLRTLREQIKAEKLDALLVTFPIDIRYLTGFSGEDSWALVTPRSLVVISDHRFDEELKGTYGYCESAMRPKGLAEELAKVVKRKKVKKLGFQAEHLSVAQRKALVKHLGASSLKETENWLVKQRAIKDKLELRTIEMAVKVQEAAFRELLEVIKPGMTENEVAALLIYKMQCHGAMGPSFNTIVGAGANSSIPHYRPGAVKLKNHHVVLIDFGALYGNYCSDMTRTIAFGRMPKKIREFYPVVREAQQAGIEAIKPGADLKEVDKVARDVIKKAGYGKQFRHGLGHGIGLEIHEEPRLSFRAEGILEAGQVVTVEPGIYFPGVGGVRLEDDVLVTETGYRNLCSLPTDLESAII